MVTCHAVFKIGLLEKINGRSLQSQTPSNATLIKITPDRLLRSGSPFRTRPLRLSLFPCLDLLILQHHHPPLAVDLQRPCFRQN